MAAANALHTKVPLVAAANGPRLSVAPHKTT
jgi:hypothetical protein